jgi:superfamily II DNA or RNA helicase
LAPNASIFPGEKSKDKDGLPKQNVPKFEFLCSNRLKWITQAERRERFRIAAENSIKQKAISELLQAHSEDSILIIGQYIEQIQSIASHP